MRTTQARTMTCVVTCAVASPRRRAREYRRCRCRRRHRRRRARAPAAGDNGADDERRAGFGMARARVTHAQSTDAPDDAGDGILRRVIETTRTRRAAALRRRPRRVVRRLSDRVRLERELAERVLLAPQMSVRAATSIFRRLAVGRRLREAHVGGEFPRSAAGRPDRRFEVLDRRVAARARNDLRADLANRGKIRLKPRGRDARSGHGRRSRRVRPRWRVRLRGGRVGKAQFQKKKWA